MGLCEVIVGDIYFRQQYIELLVFNLHNQLIESTILSNSKLYIGDYTSHAAMSSVANQ